MTTLAIDIGGTKLAAALIDSRLTLLERREVPTPASQTPAALAAALAALVAPLSARADRFAIASTGIIQDGILTAINPANLGGLAHFPLQACLSDLTALPGIALNDAQAAAWAEYHALPEKVSEMLFLTVSTGVGGGIVSQGRLQTGRGGWPAIAVIHWRILPGRSAAAVGKAVSKLSLPGAVSRRRPAVSFAGWMQKRYLLWRGRDTRRRRY